MTGILGGVNMIDELINDINFVDFVSLRLAGVDKDSPVFNRGNKMVKFLSLNINSKLDLVSICETTDYTVEQLEMLVEWEKLGLDTKKLLGEGIPKRYLECRTFAELTNGKSMEEVFYKNDCINLGYIEDTEKYISHIEKSLGIDMEVARGKDLNMNQIVAVAIHKIKHLPNALIGKSRMPVYMYRDIIHLACADADYEVLKDLNTIGELDMYHTLLRYHITGIDLKPYINDFENGLFHALKAENDGLLAKQNSGELHKYIDEFEEFDL